MIIKKASSRAEIDECTALRKTVFVDEQKVPVELEIDEYDDENAECSHFLIYENEKAIGTYRIISEIRGEAHFQRFCILKEYRKKGIGKAALSEAESFCTSEDCEKMTLNAQCYAVGFYEKSGFKVVSDVFDDAGIPHVTMEKQLDNEAFQKKKQLFLNQKKLLDTFLEKKAITQAQYNKSYGDLVVLMGMRSVADEIK